MLKITIGNRITECNEALRYSIPPHTGVTLKILNV